MADPGSLVDVGSQLRGLSQKSSKIEQLRPWPQCPHMTPEYITQPWCSLAHERPKATRNPALGADYVLDGIRPSAPGHLTDSIVDLRNPREIIGVSSRVDARTDPCCRSLI